MPYQQQGAVIPRTRAQETACHTPEDKVATERRERYVPVEKALGKVEILR